MVIGAPSDQVGNFFKEFKCLTTATGSSKWDKIYMKMIACNFLFNFIPKE
jgi:hypothetical protein